MQHHMIQPERNEVQSCDMHDFTEKQGVLMWTHFATQLPLDHACCFPDEILY